MRTKGIESLYPIHGFEKNSCLIEKTQKPGLIDVKHTICIKRYCIMSNKIDTCTCIKNIYLFYYYLLYNIF